MTPSEEYRLIPLTQGLFARVSPDDFDWLSMWKWYAASGSNGVVAQRRESDSPKRTVLMHRFIMGLESGDRRQVDHKNHDTLDNQRSNLRVCTHAENTRNRRVHSSNKLGIKGVERLPHGRYRATICIDRKRIRLGTVDTIEEAKALYDEAARKHFGEFACR